MKLGPIELSRSRPVELSQREQDIMTVRELSERYSVVRATDDYVVATPIQLRSADAQPYLPDTIQKPLMAEIGNTGKSSWVGLGAQEYNPDLIGTAGLVMYNKMRKSDAQVRAVLNLAKTPVVAARWFVDSDDQTKRGKTIAEFVNNCFFNYMTTSFPQMLHEILYFLDYGYYMMEKVYVKYDDKIIWKKFAPRHPMNVYKMNFDEAGGPRSVEFQDPRDAKNTYTIPISKLAIFTYDMEDGDLTGVSILRSAYKHWYFKENLYKIDAIQKERHGVGIPVIVLPPNFNAADSALADEIGRNLRSNEKSFLKLPPNWEIQMLKLEGLAVDIMSSIEHHDKMIARNILGQFINEATSSTESQELFMKAMRYVAEIIRDVFNKYCIPQLVAYNWGPQEIYPELKVRRLGDTVDWRTISFALRNFVGADILRPDDDLETWIRREMDLPRADPETSRKEEPPDPAAEGGEGGAPGGPQPPTSPKVGLPRQSKTKGMKQAKSAGGKNVGTDKSGG